MLPEVAYLRAATHIAAPCKHVWDLLIDWEHSTAWMVDATSVTIIGEQREDVGTRMRAVSKVAGISLPDDMTVTRWEPHRLVEVTHTGWPIRGVGWFDLVATGAGCRFEWAEEIDPPLGPAGELGALLFRRYLNGMLRRSVAKLKRLAERDLSPRSQPDGPAPPPWRSSSGRQAVASTAAGSSRPSSGGLRAGGSGTRFGKRRRRSRG